MENLSRKIKEQAGCLGFDLIGITDAKPLEGQYRDYFQKWLETECPFGLSYLRRNVEKRFEPSKLMKGARSVIVVGVNYKPDNKHLPSKEGNNSARVSIYACYPDYHRYIKNKLFQLAEFIQNNTDKSARFKACVDSAPLAERSLAVKAGLGFIGKNRMLINPSFGTSIFLGELLTNVSLIPDEPKPDLQQCGDCKKCVENCPTGALKSSGEFEAEKCINYLTIEHEGDIDEDITPEIGNRVFGCDNCVTVCPFYNKAPANTHPDFVFQSRRCLLEPYRFLQMEESEFRERFGDSCIYRSGLARLRRNAEICLNNNS